MRGVRASEEAKSRMLVYQYVHESRALRKRTLVATSERDFNEWLRSPFCLHRQLFHGLDMIVFLASRFLVYVSVTSCSLSPLVVYANDVSVDYIAEKLSLYFGRCILGAGESSLLISRCICDLFHVSYTTCNNIARQTNLRPRSRGEVQAMMVIVLLGVRLLWQVSRNVLKRICSGLIEVCFISCEGE